MLNTLIYTRGIFKGKGINTSVLYRLMSQGLAFITPLLIIKSYGMVNYGLYSLIIVLIGLCPLMDWGKSIAEQNKFSRGSGDFIIDCKVFRQIGFHSFVNVIVSIILWKYRHVLLGIIIPQEMLGIIELHKFTILILLLLISLSGALYISGSIVNGLGHVDFAYKVDFYCNFLIIILVGLGVLLKANIDTIVLLSALNASLFLSRVTMLIYIYLFHGKFIRNEKLGDVTVETRGRFQSVRVAGMFFYLQLLSLMANNIDNVYLSRTRSLENIGLYSFLMKIFSLPILVTSVINSNYWPIFSAHVYRPDGDGGRKMLWELIRKNLIISLIICIFIAFIAVPFYEILVDKKLDDLVLLGFIGISTIILVLRTSITTYVNAAEFFSMNIIGNTVFSIFAIIVKVNLVDLYAVRGLVLSNIITYILFLFPFHLLAMKFHLKKYKQVPI